VLLASLLWGTTGTVAHYAPVGSTAALIGLATFGFGGVLLGLVDSRNVLTLLRTRSALPMLGIGAVGVIAYAGCYYWSMSLVGVAIGNALALGSGPVFAALLETFIERKPVSRRFAAATTVSAAGIAALAASTAGETTDAARASAGVLLALVAGLGYAGYAWAGARLIGRGLQSRPVMAGIFSCAAVPLLIGLIAIGPGPLASGRGPLIIGYLAVVPMALAYLLFGYGLRALAASTATTLALAEPVVATVLAVLVVGERLPILGWVGLAIVLAVIVLVAAAERGADPIPV
jgi:DME family drug/metabolite transporter